MPMSLGVEHLIHANVVCSDFDRSLDFYTRVLGASILAPGVQTLDAGEPLSRAFMMRGDSKCRVAFLYWGADTTCIDLIQYFDSGRLSNRNARDTGLARIALRVKDFDAALRWLESNGVELAAGPEAVTLADGRGRRLATFFDPDGVLLEVVEYAELLGSPATPDS
jgi:catechol 2,3-dioxygenase-like lactoylglutathione lyase family enzyme